MSVTTMSCQGIRNESHDVVVEIPLSLKERCGLYLGHCWERCSSLLCVLGVLLIILSVIALLTSVVWVTVLVDEGCHIPPTTALEDLSIRDMIVYQNNAVTTSPDLQWQVKSNFSVTLRAWNTNTVAGCFSTYRRVVVYVEYHDTVILKREVPLGFGLKPRSSRPMVVEVNGDHFPVKKELGELLQAELRIASSVRLQIYFYIRVMRNDKKAEWIRMGCQVVAKAPVNSSQVGGNLLSKSCGLS
jgi:hypothetical protein